MKGMAYVLLVDDDRQQLEALAAVFEDPRFEVLLSGDGFDALEKATRFHPDIVITDHEMPRLDGVTLCERLRSQPDFATVLLVLTSAREPPVKTPVWDVFLRKPVEKFALASLMGKRRRV
ncbi:response regulator [Paraburkholderia caledonica]